jgi:hypothetical protein
MRYHSPSNQPPLRLLRGSGQQDSRRLNGLSGVGEHFRATQGIHQNCAYFRSPRAVFSLCAAKVAQERNQVRADDGHLEFPRRPFRGRTPVQPVHSRVVGQTCLGATPHERQGKILICVMLQRHQRLMGVTALKAATPYFCAEKGWCGDPGVYRRAFTDRDEMPDRYRSPVSLRGKVPQLALLLGSIALEKGRRAPGQQVNRLRGGTYLSLIAVPPLHAKTSHQPRGSAHVPGDHVILGQGRPNHPEDASHEASSSPG